MNWGIQKANGCKGIPEGKKDRAQLRMGGFCVQRGYCLELQMDSFNNVIFSDVVLN